MEPEIARRCPDCGASVRGGSFFCPQCGRKLKAAAASNAGPAVESSETPARRKTDAGAISPTLDASTSANEPASIAASAQSVPSRGAEDDGRTRSAVVIPQESDDDGRSKRQGMTAAARDAFEEKLSPRVEKLRHASNVMLEEASYDPSLRFVLVAVAIVLLSLLILLLNYLLG